MGVPMNWERYRRAQAQPVVVARDGRVWWVEDWDFDEHRPKPGREPIR